MAYLLVNRTRCGRDQLRAIYNHQDYVTDSVLVERITSWDTECQSHKNHPVNEVDAYYVRPDILYVLLASRSHSLNLLFSLNDDPEQSSPDPVDFLNAHNALSLVKFAACKESPTMQCLVRRILEDGLDEGHARVCLDALVLRFVEGESFVQLVNEWTFEPTDLSA